MNLLKALTIVGFIGVLCMSKVTFAKVVSAEDFVEAASIANQFEIDSSMLALKKSGNNQVISFAQMMVDDHKKTGEKLALILQSSELKPADELDDKHKKIINSLESSSKEDFDSKYITAQTKAHEEAVALFTHYSEQGEDGALQRFATETLPTLKEHLRKIKQLGRK